ncbi:MAG: hypothetical protein V4616_03875 [Bacteroidota bacterium]
MDALTAQLANPEPFKLQHRIIQQVVAQLQKDFDDIVIDVTLSGDESPYDQLRREIRPVVDWLLEKRPERLFTLFYRIDIPEQRVKQLMASSDEVDIVDEYTDLILDRELQKVIIRNFYSGS